MCNEYENQRAYQAYVDEFSQLKLPLSWAGGHSSNLEPRESYKISDPAPLIQRAAEGVELIVLPWAWPDERTGKAVFNFRSEGRSFAASRRLLIPADAFFEYVDPVDPKQKRKTKLRITIDGAPRFWIAGIEKFGRYTMLTQPAAPELFDRGKTRQPAVIRPGRELDWLDLTVPEAEVLHPSPPGELIVEQVYPPPEA